MSNKIRPLGPKRARKKMTRTRCRGCRNDYYNTHPHHDGCWTFPSATLMTRRYMVDNSTPTFRENFVEIKNLPSCYHRAGYYYTNDISRYPSRKE